MNLAGKLLFNTLIFNVPQKWIRTLTTIAVDIWSELEQENKPAGIYHIGKSFLRNMVRSIVGTLVNIGIHKITLDDFNSIIEARIEIRLVFRYRHTDCI
jgi:tRNA pseudouridine38-40 synthase